MRIALINNLYGEYSRGGAEAIVRILKTSLIKQGHQVIVIATKPGFKIKKTDTEYYLPSLYYNLNKYPTICKLLWQAWQFITPLNSHRLKKILNQEKVDLVLSHNLMGFGWRSFRMLTRLPLKHAHYLHDIQLLHPSGRLLYKQERILNSVVARLYQRLQRKTTNSIQYIIAPSNWILNLHKKAHFFSQAKTLQIFNPINQVHSTNEPKNQNFSFLYLGQIDYHKGVHLLLESFWQIKDKQNTELLIAGDGPDLKLLKTKYPADNIKFLGSISPNNLDSLFKQTDCLVVPSLIYENLPTSLLLAVTYNIPIIASDLGGNPEIIEKFGGQLFKPGNTRELSLYLLETINQKIKLKTRDVASLWPNNYLNKIFQFLDLT